MIFLLSHCSVQYAWSSLVYFEAYVSTKRWKKSSSLLCLMWWQPQRPMIIENLYSLVHLWHELKLLVECSVKLAVKKLEDNLWPKRHRNTFNWQKSSQWNHYLINCTNSHSKWINQHAEQFECWKNPLTKRILSNLEGCVKRNHKTIKVPNNSRWQADGSCFSFEQKICSSKFFFSGPNL